MERDRTRDAIRVGLYGQLFLKFLKEKKLYKEYIYNRKRYSDRISLGEYPSKWSIFSFKWSSTAEGTTVWETFHKEWNGYYARHIAEIEAKARSLSKKYV